ncbi:hypothetical protein [Succinivibrio dextrinosolvens]|uniref:hypothetical protein n=1 Tax=Succinivibrio dextrinosolvens TaxID=83771 RepID=UPI001920FE17|nr:hypothetical protein [Succinivibrio dextrinosolvens]
MTDISMQSSSQDFNEENASKHKNAPSYDDYFNNKITFKQYPLSECGFLTGRDCKIRFIKKSISDEFRVSPSVNRVMVEGELSEQIDVLSKWDRLYIEIFGYKYVVSHSQRSDRILILNDNNEHLNSVNLDVIPYNDENELSNSNVNRIGSFLYLSMQGNEIRLWYKESDNHDLSRINNLKWRIPILYIIAHAYVRKFEDIDSKLDDSKRQNDIYEDFGKFRLKKFRFNPVLIEKSVIANDIWNFFSEHLHVEKTVNEISNIITEIKREKDESIMRKITKISAAAGILSAVIGILCSGANDGLELSDKIFGTGTSKVIVAFFKSFFA